MNREPRPEGVTAAGKAFTALAAAILAIFLAFKWFAPDQAAAIPAVEGTVFEVTNPYAARNA